MVGLKTELNKFITSLTSTAGPENMSNSWVIFHGYVSSAIAVVIIFLNSIAIYRMVKPKSRVEPISNDDKGTSTRLQTMERSIQKDQNTVKELEYITENGKTKAQLAKKNEAIKSRILNRKKKIAKCTVVLINLAISDLVVGIDIILVKMLFFIIMKIENKQLLYALAFLRSCLLPISLMMSITNLILLTILRFYAVKRPLKYMTITRKFFINICILQWVLISMSVACHFAFSYRINGSNSVSSYSRVMYYLIAPLSVIIATIAFVITYFFIFNAIRTRITIRKINNVNQTKRREKAFQVAFYTVIAFVVFWLPSSGLRIYERVTGESYPIAGLVLSYFVFLNSVANPIIYFTVFRKQP